MSEELQNESTTVGEEAQTETIVNPEKGSELATGTETTEQTQVDVEAEQKTKTQDFINKQVGEGLRLKRELAARDAELDQLKQAQAQSNIPQDIGDFPKEFDFDSDEQFNQAKTEYLNRVNVNANYQAQQTVNNNVLLAQQQVAQAAQAKNVNDKVAVYTKRATEFGISSQELQEAGNVVAGYGISDNLTMAILGDPDGALITKYLASNPLEIDQLGQMDSFSAALHIERSIRAKAVALKPKTSSAPAPGADIQGNGVDPEAGKYPFIKGGTITTGS